MKGGAIDSIVVQDPFKMGYESAKAMAQVLDGQEPVREMDSGAYLITPENIETPEMQAIVFPDITTWLSGAPGSGFRPPTPRRGSDTSSPGCLGRNA